MGKFYADRMFLESGGNEVVDIETMDLTVNENLVRKETMTRSRRSAGFTKGNKAISMNVTLAVESDNPQINIALKDPASTLTLVAIIGGDRFSFIDVEQSQMTATGTVGTASKTLALEAIDFVDENGRSRLSDLGL